MISIVHFYAVFDFEPNLIFFKTPPTYTVLMNGPSKKIISYVLRQTENYMSKKPLSNVCDSWRPLSICILTNLDEVWQTSVIFIYKGVLSVGKCFGVSKSVLESQRVQESAYEFHWKFHWVMRSVREWECWGVVESAMECLDMLVSSFECSVGYSWAVLILY